MVLSFECVNTVHYDPNRLPDPRAFDPDCYKDGLQSLCKAASDPMLQRDTFTLVLVEESDELESVGLFALLPLWAGSERPSLCRSRGCCLFLGALPCNGFSQCIDSVVVDMRYEVSGIVKGNLVLFRVDCLTVIQDKTTSRFRNQ